MVSFKVKLHIFDSERFDFTIAELFLITGSCFNLYLLMLPAWGSLVNLAWKNAFIMPMITVIKVFVGLIYLKENLIIKRGRQEE